MDSFTPYGNDFREVSSNLRKVLQNYGELNLSFSLEKCLFLMNEGFFLGNFVSSKGIKVDPSNMVISKNVPIG